MDFGHPRASFPFLIASSWSFSTSTNAWWFQVLRVKTYAPSGAGGGDGLVTTLLEAPLWSPWPARCNGFATDVQNGMWSWAVDVGAAAPDGGGRRGSGLDLPRYDGSTRQSRCLAGVWVATWMETARAEGSST